MRIRAMQSGPGPSRGPNRSRPSNIGPSPVRPWSPSRASTPPTSSPAPAEGRYAARVLDGDGGGPGQTEAALGHGVQPAGRGRNRCGTTIRSRAATWVCRSGRPTKFGAARRISIRFLGVGSRSAALRLEPGQRRRGRTRRRSGRWGLRPTYFPAERSSSRVWELASSQGADVGPVKLPRALVHGGEQVCGLVPGRHVGAPPGTPGRKATGSRLAGAAQSARKA